MSSKRNIRAIALSKRLISCNACGKNDHLTKDHIWPKSKGGCSCFSNIMLLCYSCNQEKANEHDGISGHKKEDCPIKNLNELFNKARIAIKTKNISEAEILIFEFQNLEKIILDAGIHPREFDRFSGNFGNLRAFVKQINQEKKANNDLEYLKKYISKLKRKEQSLLKDAEKLNLKIKKLEEQL